jgi:hypothetical protein
MGEGQRLFVESNTGIMCVVPAWRIGDLLDQTEPKAFGDKYDRDVAPTIVLPMPPTQKPPPLSRSKPVAAMRPVVQGHGLAP